MTLHTDPSKTKFLHMSPVLASGDVARDIKWYEDKMGFENVFDSTAYSEGPVDYAVLGRQNQYLHLQFQYPKDMTSTDIRFQVVNLNPLYEELKQTGAAKQEPWKTSWGTIEFGLLDLSGNRLTFFEDV